MPSFEKLLPQIIFCYRNSIVVCAVHSIPYSILIPFPFPIPLLQELNSKAESKFNKLKAQAKTKIANLNRELEKLRAEKGGGDTSFNVSTLVRKEHLGSAFLHIYSVYSQWYTRHHSALGWFHIVWGLVLLVAYIMYNVQCRQAFRACECP